MRNQIKYLKVLFIFTMFLLMLNSVYANIFATIAMQEGLKFVDPTIAKSVNEIISKYNCGVDISSCLTGKITGEIQGKMFKEIQEISPEAANAINEYEKIKGYINKGALISKELQINGQGNIENGKIEFKEEKGYLGKEFSFDNDEAVEVKNAEVEFSDKYNKITFNKEGSLSINQGGKETEFINIKPNDEKSKTTAYIKTNKKGQISEADFTVNEKGGSYVFGNDIIPVPPNSRVQYSNGVIKMDPPEGSEFKELPSKIQNPNKDIASNEIYITGKNLKFQNGNVLQDGELISKDGKIYIGGNKRVTIDNLNFYPKFRMRTFFDGQVHADAGEDYISLNPDKKNMYLLSKDQSIGILDFNKGNPFVKVEDGESFALITRSEAHNLELGITNPTDKIPELNVKSFSGKANIYNGKYFLFSYEEGLGVSSYQTKDNNAPMDIKFNTLSPEGKALLINKDNSYAILSESNLQQYTALKYQEPPVSDLQKVLIDKIQKETPWIKYEKIEQIPLGSLQVYYDQLSQMPDSLKKATTMVKFEPQITNLGDEIMGLSDLHGRVTLSVKYLTGEEGVVSHEFFHNLVFLKERDLQNQISIATSEQAKMNEYIEISDKLNYILQKEGVKSLSILPPDISESENGKIVIKLVDDPDYEKKLINLPEHVREQIFRELSIQNQRKAYLTNTLDQAWLNIGSNYFLQLGISTGQVSSSQLPTVWSGGGYGAWLGCVSPYACVNPGEDMAETAEKALYNPTFFKCLINPNCKEYDPKYQQKLEVLMDFDIIPIKQYQQILTIAGVSTN